MVNWQCPDCGSDDAVRVREIRHTGQWEAECRAGGCTGFAMRCGSIATLLERWHNVRALAILNRQINHDTERVQFVVERRGPAPSIGYQPVTDGDPGGYQPCSME